MKGSLIRRLKKNREVFLDRHAEAGDWFKRMFSSATYSSWRMSASVIARYCRGLVLDAGSGRGSWRHTILRSASACESIDIAPRGEDQPTWIGDLMHMSEVPDVRFDTVVCNQVLEHVRSPLRALSEMHRVLKPGGVLILSAPLLSRRHELPYDFFRYTQEGLTALLQDVGYEVREVLIYGGLLSFIHHQTSFFFPGLLMGIPLVGEQAICLNAPFSWLFPRLDRLIDRGALLPLGVVIVGAKGAGRTSTGQ